MINNQINRRIGSCEEKCSPAIVEKGEKKGIPWEDNGRRRKMNGEKRNEKLTSSEKESYIASFISYTSFPASLFGDLSFYQHLLTKTASRKKKKSTHARGARYRFRAE